MNDMTQTEPGTALALPDQSALATMFRSQSGMDGILARIEAEARSHAPELTTAKGRKAVASLAFKVAQSKTALDAAGKALNEDARAQIAVVDAERRKVRDRLDALRDEVRKPLDDWEAAEVARVEAIKARVEKLRTAHSMLPDGASSEQIADLLARVESALIDATYAEFQDEASMYRGQAVATLGHMLSTAQNRETAEAEAAHQAEELAALRAEKAAREDADRIAREAADREAARVAQERAEASHQRDLADRLISHIKAASMGMIDGKSYPFPMLLHEVEDRVMRDMDGCGPHAAEVMAVREAALLALTVAYEDQTRKATERAEAEKEEAATRAAQAERDRIAAQAKAEADARAKREADQAHRQKIAKDIADALRTMSGAATPELIAEAIMEGRIPHVRAVL